MDSRTDIVRKGDDIKQIYSLSERVICVLTILFFSIVSIILLTNFRDDIFLSVHSS